MLTATAGNSIARTVQADGSMGSTCLWEHSLISAAVSCLPGNPALAVGEKAVHVRCWCQCPLLHCQLQVWQTVSAGLTCSRRLLVPGRTRSCLAELWDTEGFCCRSQGTFPEGGERSELEAFEIATKCEREVPACGSD